MIDEVIVYVDEENNVPFSTSISVYQYETVIPAAPSSSTPSTTFATSTTSPAAVPPASTATPTTLATLISTPAPASPLPSTAPAPQTAPSPASSPAAPVQHNAPAAPASSPAAAQEPAPSTAAQPNSPPAQGSDFALGISYSPYSAPDTCKSDGTQVEELAALANYNVIRLYDSNCNSVSNVVAATKGKVQIFAGFPDLTDFQKEITDLQTQVNGDWNLIHSVGVGNEIVGSNPSDALANQVAAAVTAAKNNLQHAGYNGPVVAVDNMMIMNNYTQLCGVSDYCAINCHTFWDGHASPEDAGDFVLKWVETISGLQGGKKTVVTESGWPTQGAQYINSIPSQSNMQTTIASLKATFSNNIILYSAYDTTWQSGADQQYWGIIG